MHRDMDCHSFFNFRIIVPQQVHHGACTRIMLVFRLFFTFLTDIFIRFEKTWVSGELSAVGRFFLSGCSDSDIVKLRRLV